MVADSEVLKFWQLHGHPPNHDSPERLLQMREESRAIRLEVQRSRLELHKKVSAFHDQFGNLHKRLAVARDVKGNPAQAHFRFLAVELLTAETFCQGTRHAFRDPRKREQSRKKAREAYDTIQRFKGRASLGADENNAIDERLIQLRKDLEQLGETF